MVKYTESNKGFSLIELLVIVAILGILLAMTGAFSTKALLRRSVDGVTLQVSNTLQSTKMKAARNGVEYRTQFSLSGDTFNAITHYGDSNNDSTIWTTVGDATVLGSSTARDADKSGVIGINLDNTVVISSFTAEFEFKLSGRGDTGSVLILSSKYPQIDRCGEVTVTALGLIRTKKGHWDGSTCSQVSDD